MSEEKQASGAEGIALRWKKRMDLFTQEIQEDLAREIQSAILAEREACARIAEQTCAAPGKSAPWSKIIAQKIRERESGTER